MQEAGGAIKGDRGWEKVTDDDEVINESANLLSKALVTNGPMKPKLNDRVQN